MTGLINANPIVYEKKERRLRPDARDFEDEYAVESIDNLEIFDQIKHIKDPEHPYSLEELKVITEDSIEIDDKRNHVRVTFTPTVEHCSMATVINPDGEDAVVAHYGGLVTRVEEDKIINVHQVGNTEASIMLVKLEVKSSSLTTNHPRENSI